MSKKYEMSSVQKRLYIIDKVQGENIYYNIPIFYKVVGSIEDVRLQYSLNELCKSYEVLRTRFMESGGNFYQVVEDKVNIIIEYFNGIQTDFIRPFDLSKLPLMRVAIIKDGEDKILMFDFHHIIFDGGSVPVFFEKLAAIYDGLETQSNRLQYTNYTKWIKSLNMKAEEKFWSNEIIAEDTPLNIRTDFPRKEVRSYRGAEIQNIIKENVYNKIKKYSISEGITENVFFLSAFYILLSRYSRQKDIYIGIPVAGRNHPQIQDMIGMFVNTLVMKSSVKENIKVIDYLKEVKEKFFQVFDNREYPYEKLVENIAKKQEHSRNPLFDVMFVFQNNEKNVLELGEAKLELIDVENKVSKFDITLCIDQEKNGYSLRWEYCVDLFKEQTIKRIAKQYNNILDEIIQKSQCLVKDINLYSNREIDDIVNKFNSTKTFYSGLTIVELFEQQVKKYPERIAVEYDKQTLTYRQLNEKANYIGQMLRKMEIGENDIVAAMFYPSLEMIIGIYGILKAGAAYLPIDAGQPFERINYMLEESRVRILLTVEKSKIADLYHNIELVDLLECKEIQSENLLHISTQDSLAYIIFTSGTTGRPKGVLIRNKGVVNLSQWFANDGEYTPESTIIQNFNYVFDGSVPEIFSATLSGCKLLVLTDLQRKDPESIIDILPGAQITMVPSMFRAILDYLDIYPQKISQLKLVEKLNLAAEVFEPKLLSRVKNMIGEEQIRLANNYGPTEVTVCATSYTIDMTKQYSTIPIGKPIANTKIYIMEQGRICGVGIPGEICIAGVGISAGYLNQPGLNAEKFVKNSYCENEILYKTGDLGYWDETGNIEYLGRIDNQVKLNGFRIEICEIENALRSIKGINDAVVVLSDEKIYKVKHLCAYIVSKNKIDLKHVKEELEKSLPHYMIPIYYSQIKELPTNNSGKVAVDRLPKAELISNKEYCAPRNYMDKQIISIFEQVLGVENIGIEDDFFELGGNSLKVILITNLIEETLKKKVSISEIFKYRTVGEISSCVSKSKDINNMLLIPKAVEL